MSLCKLVDLAKLRWHVEHDYRDLKLEIGLGHYEGRGRPGFRHHGTLCIAACSCDVWAQYSDRWRL